MSRHSFSCIENASSQSNNNREGKFNFWLYTVIFLSLLCPGNAVSQLYQVVSIFFLLPLMVSLITDAARYRCHLFNNTILSSVVFFQFRLFLLLLVDSVITVIRAEDNVVWSSGNNSSKVHIWRMIDRDLLHIQFQ